MRNQVMLILSSLLFIIATSGYSQEIIFLHHSTGAGVYNAGNVASWIANYNSVHGTSYDITEKSYPDDPYPWANYPYDYWNLWINNACDNTEANVACLNSLCANYDVIIFKHCFPGASISADDPVPSISSSKKTIANYKLQYRALRDLMDTYHDNKFIVWTLAPLHRLATSVVSASRAKEFVDWVKNEWLSEDGKSHPNIYIFDFFGYVAESDPAPVNGQLNCLKYEYEGSHTDSDSHPNTVANEFVGPVFAQFIVSTIEDDESVKVSDITVTGAGGATTITTMDGTLQLSAAISPANATNKAVTWSIQNGTGQATINTAGLVTAVANGTVTATATAADGSEVSGNLTITITGQTISVTGIAVTGAGGATTITTMDGTLQLSATVSPANANNKAVTWSIQNGTGKATINTAGLVTAIANGTVTATATAADGSGVSGNLTITITGQTIAVTGIAVTGAGGATTITTMDGTLQLSATVSPANATNKAITWSIQNGTGKATINTAGLVTAVANGTVTATAAAADGSGVSGSLTITITGQTIAVTGIAVTGAGGATTITTMDGTLQLSAAISPANATNKAVTWSIQNGTGQATINTAGLVTAVANGTVTATATAADGSGISGSLVITISNEAVKVIAIVIYGTDFETSIYNIGSTLQLNTFIAPDNASNKSVTWSVQNVTGKATISNSGLLQAVAFGKVTVKATANDGSGISGVLNISIRNQNPSTAIDEFAGRPFQLQMTQSEIQIKLPINTSFHHINLYNISGNLLLTGKILDQHCILDISTLPPGIYIIQFLNSAGNLEAVKVCRW